MFKQWQVQYFYYLKPNIQLGINGEKQLATIDYNTDVAKAYKAAWERLITMTREHLEVLDGEV